MTFNRLIREEAGMTLALAIMMIVIIGVMGAGLLTFVQRDLESVIEVNRGQKAIEVADAGVQAAKQQLIANSFPDQYNDPATFSPSPDPANNSWAFNIGAAACGDLPSGPGKCITTPDGRVRVTIRYLPPPTNMSATGSGSRGDPKYAPDSPPCAGGISAGCDYTNGRDFFRVESDGIYNGARRKVQAIFKTEDLGIPKSYFANKDITLNGGPTITNFSLFSKGSVNGVQCNTLSGKDTAYGDWKTTPKDPYNDKARLDSTRTAAVDPDAPGIGAAGSITYVTGGGSGCSGFNNDEQHQSPASTNDFYKRRDFDGLTTYTPGTITDPSTLSPSDPNYRFCAKGTACWPAGTPQPANVITYPFDPTADLNVDLLKSIALQQSNYVEQTASAGTVYINESNFHQTTPPLDSVFVVKFTGPSAGLVDVKPTVSNSPCSLKGTILVVNGSVETDSGGVKCFDGVISIQDQNSLGTLYYKNNGNFTLNGFVNVDGTMTIAGSVNPLVGNDVLNMPGYHDIKLWSWRECYSTDCT